MEKVVVHLETSDGFEIIKYIPCASLPCDKPGTTYVLVRLPDDPTQGRYPAITRCSPNIGLMLARRLRRWSNINPTLGKHLVLDV